MPDSDVYTILRRATSPEDEVVWREVATIETDFAYKAIDEYVATEAKAGRSAEGQYLVAEIGSYHCKRYDVVGRTEYDVEEPKRLEARVAA